MANDAFNPVVSMVSGNLWPQNKSGPLNRSVANVISVNKLFLIPCGYDFYVPRDS